MKKIKYSLIFILSIFSCQNHDNNKKSAISNREIELNRRIDSLNNVIEQKKESVENLNWKYTVTKYAFAVIDILIPLMNYDSRDEIHIPQFKQESRISNILQIEDFTKEKEQRFIDEFNEKIIFDTQPKEISIKKRKCYSFDSYEEASLAREKMILDN